MQISGKFLCVLILPILIGCQEKEVERLSLFQPGAIWPDTDGNHINAHGAGFLIHEGIYYWFGHIIESKLALEAPHTGILQYERLKIKPEEANLSILGDTTCFLP